MPKEVNSRAKADNLLFQSRNKIGTRNIPSAIAYMRRKTRPLLRRKSLQPIGTLEPNSARSALPLQKPCDLTCHAFSRSPHIAIRQMGISSGGFDILVTEQLPNHFKSKAASETK